MTPRSDEEIRAWLEVGPDDDDFNDVAFELADVVGPLLDRVTTAERERDAAIATAVRWEERAAVLDLNLTAALAEVARLKEQVQSGRIALALVRQQRADLAAERYSLQASITAVEKFAEPRGAAERRDPSLALGRMHTVREFLAVLAVPTEPEKENLARSTGAGLIAAERQRQIDVEGYAPAHDREHNDAALAMAAACYATPDYLRPMTFHVDHGDSYLMPTLWPWTREYWKPTPDDRVRELAKAGALIAAEIDRLTPGVPTEPETPLATCEHGYTGTHDQMEYTEWGVNHLPPCPGPGVPAETEPAEPGKFDFEAHLYRQRKWSGATFGPGDRAKGVVEHIRKELDEVEEDPSDLTEWIDVVILALDGAWRSGAAPRQIIDALVAKQTRNEGRTWPDWRTAPADRAIEHLAEPAEPETPFSYLSHRDYSVSSLPAVPAEPVTEEPQPASEEIDVYGELRRQIASGAVKVWCYCYDSPEPDGPWVAPDDFHADVHVLPVVQQDGEQR